MNAHYNNEQRREACLKLIDYYYIKLLETETYLMDEAGKTIIRQYNQNMIEKYEAELLVIDLTIELGL